MYSGDKWRLLKYQYLPSSASSSSSSSSGTGRWIVVASDIFELPFSFILRDEPTTKKVIKTLLLKIGGMLQSQMEKCDECQQTKRFSAKHHLFY
jgi:hypothetical protein